MNAPGTRDSTNKILLVKIDAVEFTEQECKCLFSNCLENVLC